MQVYFTISDIAGRARKIGYGAKDLAAAAGVAESTVHRGIQAASDSRLGTHRRLLAALIAKELELRDYLLGLHPVAASPVPLREPTLPGGSDDVAALASARPARGEVEDTKLEAAE